VVVVEDAGRRAGLVADEVLGQQQIVIKSLGLNLEGVPGISGGVILPDGQVGLILDVAALLQLSRAVPADPPALSEAT
jgi:two-component system chemotaxis sensor kinase CheA